MSTNNSSRRTSRGRQRITIAKIENVNHRNVTFSKRRAGLVKKANEISTLCGVEMLLVMFSPSSKAYSFTNTSVDAILNKYFGNNNNPTAAAAAAQGNHAEQVLQAGREAYVQIQSSLINDLEMQIKEEVKQNQELREAEKRRPPICDRPLSELQSMKQRLEMLRSHVFQTLHSATISAASSQFGASNDVAGPSAAAPF